MYGKIMGAGMGWALGGPLGAVLGYFIGSSLEGKAQTGDYRGRKSSIYDRSHTTANPAGDFTGALVVLFAAVAKADKKILDSELRYIRQYFTEKFGEDNAADAMGLFNHAVKQNFDHWSIAHQIKQHLDYYSRLQLLQMLFGLAYADGEIHPEENRVLHDISDRLGVKPEDRKSIRAIYFKDKDGPYKVLGVTNQASDDEIRKAYRSLVVKYHPDKVSHLGEEFVKIAEEKFVAVKAAYDEIKKERSL